LDLLINLDLVEGLIFRVDQQLWQVGPNSKLSVFFDLPYLELSWDGLQGLYEQDNDIFIINVASGERRNLTNTTDRHECCAVWWSQERVVFGSWPETHLLFHSNNFRVVGFPSMINIDGSGYRVLDNSRPYLRGFTTNLNSQLFIFGPNQSGEAMRAGDEILHSEIETGWIEVRSDGSVRVTQFETWYESPVMSPNGNLTATYSLNQDGEGRNFERFLLLDPLTEAIQELFAFEVCGRDGPPRPPKWSPDGRFVAFHACAEGQEQGTWVYEVQSEMMVYSPLQNAPVDCGTQIAWHPDSTSFACLHWGRSNPDQYLLIELDDHLIHEFSLPDGAWLVDWR
jgi:hypothetical protein